MKSVVVAGFVCGLVLVLAAPIAAQSIGGGLSFWVPESLYLGRGGSVGVESAVGTSVGLGKLLSLPISVAYDKVFGLLPEGDAAGAAPGPWFISDSLLCGALVKAHLAAGPLYFEAFGGVAGVWHMSLSVLTGAVQSSASPGGQLAVFTAAPAVNGGRFGWGWQAGGALGVTVGQIQADLNVTYRLIRSRATVSGTYYLVDEAGPSVSGPISYGPQEINVRLAGFSVGVDVRFQM
jgi:hypothetical protein